MLTAASLAVSANADTRWGTGNGAGSTSIPSPSNQLYNMTTTNELSWKVDLYVSASSSGKVNPLTDTIGSAALPWVGSVLYDNWYNTWEGGQVYVQTNYTNNRAGLISETLTPITLGGYTSGYKVGASLPTTYKLGSDDTLYPIKDGSGRDSGMTVYHRAIDCGLPSEMEKITSANYKTLVQDKVESNDFKIIV